MLLGRLITNSIIGRGTGVIIQNISNFKVGTNKVYYVSIFYFHSSKEIKEHITLDGSLNGHIKFI